MNILDYLPKSLPIPSFGKKEDDQYYFALNITPTDIEASLWGIIDGKVEVIRTKKTSYESEEELTDIANFCLDEALADFPTEPKQVLFGVPDTWLVDDNLKEERLKQLKELVKEIDLEPMAYVSTTHAITHFLQNQTGVPLTSVLVQVADPLIVSVVKGGKVLNIKSVKRSGSLGHDIEKALLSFHDVEVLPSKILIFGDDPKLESLKEELSSFNWMGQLPFLHLPKIDTLVSTLPIMAVCFAGATEINPKVVMSQKQVNEEVIEAPKNLPTHSLREERHQEAQNLATVDEDMEERPLPAKQRDQNLEQYEEDNYNRNENSKAPLAGIIASGTAFFASLSHGGFATILRGGMLPKVGIGVLVLLIASVLSYIFIPKADVTVFLDMRTLEKESQVIADPNITSVDDANNKIPGKIVSTEVTSTKKANATGKKEIGDPAKGKVVIYNATSKAVTIAKGTTLTDSGGQKFTLDSAVNVASKSASAADPPTKSDAADATAVAIGPDGNIAAGRDLSVNGYNSSEVVAKVDQAFSGGVSKQVSVVTADDQKRLLAELSSEMRTSAREKLTTQLSGELKILEQSLSESITRRSYSKNVDDQASDFTLTLTATYKGTAYNDADLKLVVSKLIETNVPEGFEFDPQLTQTTADVSKVNNDGSLVFLAKFSAKLKPKLDEAKIKSDISGRSIDDAQTKLREIENVIGVQIENKPQLPGPLNRLPVRAENISLTVTAQ